MHLGPTSVLTEAYFGDEYWEDLLRVTGSQTDERLARLTIRGTTEALPFLEGCGVAARRQRRWTSWRARST